MNDDLVKMIREGWTRAKSPGPAEKRIHELNLADRLDEVTPEEVRALLLELRDVRRTWHPLCWRLELR